MVFVTELVCDTEFSEVAEPVMIADEDSDD